MMTHRRKRNIQERRGSSLAVFSALRSAVQSNGEKMVSQSALKWVVAHMLDLLSPALMVENQNKKLWLCMESGSEILPRLRHLRHYKNEILVDFNVMGDQPPYQSVLTAESEGDSRQPARLFKNEKLGTTDEDELLWDLYKLLVVPSPHRFFIVRSPIKFFPFVLHRVGQEIALYSGLAGKKTTFALILVPTGSLATHPVTMASWKPGALAGEPLMEHGTFF